MVRIADMQEAPPEFDIPTPREEKQILCGYCKTDAHQYCPRATRGMGPNPKIWPCPCDAPECGGGSRLRCLECKTEKPGRVDPKLWVCYDGVECNARVEARLAANPAVQLMREMKETAMARANAIRPATKTAPSKRAAEPKAGVCLVTGKATSGGLFAPGMDARYVSQLITSVVEREISVVDARKQLKNDGVSNALIAKFEKGLALRREKATAAKTAPAAKKAAAPAVKETAAQKRKRLAAAAAAAEPEEDEVEEDDEDDAEEGDDF